MPSFGEELKRERELRRISLREISESTKINIRYLEALENNDFRHLPGGVFNKGFVRAFAQFIGVDPDRMVNAYLMEEQNQGAGQTGQDSDVLRGGSGLPEDDVSATNRSKIGRTAGLILLIAVLATLTIIVGAWYYSRQSDTAGEQASLEQTADTLIREDNTVVPESTEEGEGTQTEPAAEVANENTSPSDGTVRIRIVLEQKTTGRINCDNRRVTILDDFTAAATLEFECTDFLIISAADGGAIKLGKPGEELAPLGAPGVPVDRYRILPPGKQD